MKKYFSPFTVVIAAVVFSFSLIMGTYIIQGAVFAQDDFLISPSVWNIDTTAVEEVTIHIAVPLSTINMDTLVLTVDAVEYDYDHGMDSRGELVLKFTPSMTGFEIDESYPVRVTFEYLNGDLYDESDDITVKEAELNQENRN